MKNSLTDSLPPLHFRQLCLRAALYILLIAALAQGIYIEALHFPNVRFSEYGFTELAQSGILATASALLIYTRQALKVLPNVVLLMLSFIVASLIREQNHFLDTFVADHTWKVLVALVVIPTLYHIVRRRQGFLNELAHYANSFSFGFFSSGILTTYVFSRLYGRSVMWEVILEDSYVRTFKNAAEEAVELLGYALILISVIELVILARYWAHQRAQ